MKADYATQPRDHLFHGIKPRHFSFTLRWGSWKLTEKGLFRWWAFASAKPNAKGVHALRYGWRRFPEKPCP